MNKIDDQIRKALREEDAELYDTLETEPSLYREAIGLFKGRSAWLVFVVMAAMIAEMAIAVYAGFRFYNAAAVPEMMLWAGICLVCLGAIAALKIWSWMEMHKNAIMREIKRLELQVASLANAVNDGKASPQS